MSECLVILNVKGLCNHLSIKDTPVTSNSGLLCTTRIVQTFFSFLLQQPPTPFLLLLLGSGYAFVTDCFKGCV